MENPLLVAIGSVKHGGGEEESLVMPEAKKQLYLAGPLVIGFLLQNAVQMISVMFVGHLGELALSSASVATSFAGVTGFSLLPRHAVRAGLRRGAAPPARRLQAAGDAGARVGERPGGGGVGLHRRDPGVVRPGPGHRCRGRELHPVADPGAVRVRAAAVPRPVPADAEPRRAGDAGSGAAALCHPAVCWLLVRGLGLGRNGAALANAVSYLCNLSFLALYVRLSPSCKSSWTGFSGEAFRGIRRFMKLAVPSAVMVCMEWWSFELLVLLSGLLPNPKLETAVLSICLNTSSLAFMAPLGLGASISTRVSNELGAGRPTRMVVLLGLTVGISEGLVMVLVRNLWGYAYSNEEEITRYTATMMPVLAVSVLPDGQQCVLSGVVRGCGRQKIGAFINLGAYYLVGIPAGFIFAFVCHLRGMGLLLLSITLCTNWNKEVLKAKDRVFNSALPVDMTT